MDDDTARFMLGEVGENPIICFGINPSIANANLGFLGKRHREKKIFERLLKGNFSY